MTSFALVGAWNVLGWLFIDATGFPLVWPQNWICRSIYRDVERLLTRKWRATLARSRWVSKGEYGLLLAFSAVYEFSADPVALGFVID